MNYARLAARCAAKDRQIGVPMRWVFCALVLLGLASPAVAADLDLDVLRGAETVAPPPLTVGPATFTRWSGFYVGGQIG